MQVTTDGSSPQTVTEDLHDDGNAYFKVPTSATYTFSDAVAHKVLEDTNKVDTAYKWHSGRSFEVAPNPIAMTVGQKSDMDVNLFLPEDCSDVSQKYPGITKLCYYEDADHIQNAKDQVATSLTKLSAMNAFPKAVANVKNVIVGPGLIVTTMAGFFQPYNPAEIDIQTIPLTINSGPLADHMLELAPWLLIHEGFHNLDFNNFGNTVYSPPEYSHLLSGTSPDYIASIKNQLATDTGKRVWDLVSYRCSYLSFICPISQVSKTPYAGGYNAFALNKLSGYRKDNTDNYIAIEAFAEEHTAFCFVPQQFLNGLDNIDAAWQKAYPSVAIPSDLHTVRDAVKSRILGTGLSSPLHADLAAICQAKPL